MNKVIIELGGSRFDLIRFPLLASRLLALNSDHINQYLIKKPLSPGDQIVEENFAKLQKLLNLVNQNSALNPVLSGTFS